MPLDISSFYVIGGTLQSDSPSYVERRADRELVEALTRGEFCFVLITCQMGEMDTCMIALYTQVRG